MSLHVILMAGRLGGVAGTNAMALTVFRHCSAMLAVHGAVLAASAAGIWAICGRCERKRSVVH